MLGGHCSVAFILAKACHGQYGKYGEEFRRVFVPRSLSICCRRRSLTCMEGQCVSPVGRGKNLGEPEVPTFEGR